MRNSFCKFASKRFCTSKSDSQPCQYKVVMVRHGESEWNKENRFTGWYDAQLSEKGKAEALAAGKSLKKANYKFDKAFTSTLTRAHDTLNTILEELCQTDIPIVKSWRLNERHYGALIGLNKKEIADKYGADQVQQWRRGYAVIPPLMTPDHEYYDCIVNDPHYKDDPPFECFPMGESLKLTIERALPHWNDVIVPDIKAGKRIIIASHGNSLRGIVKHLDKISDETIPSLELPTGIPFVYTLDKNMCPIPEGNLQFLDHPEIRLKIMSALKAEEAKNKKV